MAKILLCVEWHYVYYLVCPSTWELLYVGRSINPKERLKAHIKRFGRPMVLECTRRFATLEAAAEAELRAIREEGPSLNVRMVSSPGHLGHVASQKIRDTQRARMKKHWENVSNRVSVSQQFKGIPKTPEHRAKISEALVGRAYSEERRANISAGLKGKLKGIPKSPEHRAKLAAVLARGRMTMAIRKLHHG